MRTKIADKHFLNLLFSEYEGAKRKGSYTLPFRNYLEDKYNAEILSRDDRIAYNIAYNNREPRYNGMSWEWYIREKFSVIIA